MTTDEIIQEAKRRLEAAYGDRLRGVILYGSVARGEAGPESDIGLLVLLDGPISLGAEISAIVDALMDLQVQEGFPVHALPVDIADYHAGERRIYRIVAEEGVVL